MKWIKACRGRLRGDGFTAHRLCFSLHPAFEVQHGKSSMHYGRLWSLRPLGQVHFYLDPAHNSERRFLFPTMPA